jgi:hypothetical protein
MVWRDPTGFTAVHAQWICEQENMRRLLDRLPGPLEIEGASERCKASVTCDGTRVGSLGRSLTRRLAVDYGARYVSTTYNVGSKQKKRGAERGSTRL